MAHVSGGIQPENERAENEGMGWVGFEHTAKPSGNAGVPETGGAESGAVDAPKPSSEPAEPTHVDRDLARLVAAWPTLPAAMRAGILAMVNAC